MKEETMDPIPMVDLQAELNLLRNPILEMITEVLDSGNYVLGKKGETLEKLVADYVGAKHALGVANGTDALVLALKALDIGSGDEVITTPFTFFATAEAIAEVGARPVFIDIEADTYNLDPSKIEAAITPKTKAIIVVHLYGKAANMKEILSLARKYNLRIIEDACQAIGTEFEGKRVGAIGDIGCFSFFPSKNLGAFGDAGLVTTNQKTLHDTMLKLRNHGSDKKYHHSLIGMNSRLDEMQAAILLVKLYYLDIFLHKRKEVARRYTESLPEFLRKPNVSSSREHTFHQYCIELDERDKLAAELDKNHIASGVYYPKPLHVQEAFRYLNYKKGDFPIAERAASRILALPIYPMMTYEQQDYIISTIKKFLEGEKDK
ncbi:DegT/DnrJ/EryC1/StrS family aminotransferase [Oceanobacillus alkalisoli]|uniref:DegT/DnrJ/EryC1/StrS family aminotransferase n=1 Tax=Oceanobacillus alkalisoli TaxID=2925113 RepID=UPI001EE42F4B|nr:DegT/DnrJ/EryC1/StrS family aminotransferase [Oceanobacillus alkalisoli]MCG5104691.1 DegT/DnrJ/EryC1/StrS family aminotransferase [Oceanobacillus alkalisoli]